MWNDGSSTSAVLSSTGNVVDESENLISRSSLENEKLLLDDKVEDKMHQSLLYVGGGTVCPSSPPPRSRLRRRRPARSHVHRVQE